MSSVYSRLGYSFTPANANVIIAFADDTVSMLNSVPSFLDEWQYTDVGNSDVAASNYLKNPVGNTINVIISTTESINVLTTSVTGLETIKTLSNTVSNSANSFLRHTQRISGLAEQNEQTSQLPHYETAMGLGKALVYITFQSDGIQNNSPIIGSFTSILINDELQANSSNLTTYKTIIQNSIIGGEPPTTNLTAGQISTIESFLTGLSGYLTTRRTHDENFYINAQNVLEDVQKVRKFNNLGQTEQNLFRNYLGTDRLIANISPAVISNTAVIT